MSNKNVVSGVGTPAGNRALDATLGFHSLELSASVARFPDGAQMRVEIPSVENPEAMAAVIEEADRRGVTVHRVSQGSGAMLLSEKELSEMAAMGSDRGIEVSLFVARAKSSALAARCTRVKVARCRVTCADCTNCDTP